MNQEKPDPISDARPPATIAQLDAKRVYWGIKTIPADQLTTDDVEVPADCDLAPGRYKHSLERKRFEPMLEPAEKPNVISVEQVLCELAKIALGQGVKSELLASYIVQYENSIDQVKDIDGGAK